MAHHIIKLGEHYLTWSTVVEAPVSRGMNLDDFKRYYQARYVSTDTLDIELALVEVRGVSTIVDDLDSLISCNRAGDKERHLTISELIKKYCPKK
jgi:hypothetical protein